MNTPPRTECLFVCYNAEGRAIRDAVARHTCAERPFRTTELNCLCDTPSLLSADIVDVYPVFMQTGQAVRRILPERLRTTCRTIQGDCPEFRFHPVWGASPELPFYALPLIQNVLAKSSAALIVMAHGHQNEQQADEPQLFTNALAKLLPVSQTVRLCWFGVNANLPPANSVIPALAEQSIIVLPFLAGRGMHFRNDMPSPHRAAQWGKELTLLPPMGEIAATVLDNLPTSQENACCHENEDR